jgi:L-cysteine:1D-myo-inositol 2-amino-2-deoxy-alpha-D-glucopyranoside ligase
MTNITFDVINRYCQYLGWRVRYVQNVTDIDESILAKAAQIGEPWDQLGDRNILQYQEDLAALNVLPPAVYPRATGEIPLIIEINQTLIEQGRAYAREGNVYFRVERFPEYGKLSGYSPAEMIRLSAERGADPNDPLKENPLDFVLWRAALPDQPSWESPWGPGIPGWHIECSAMAMKYLGPVIDIHGGGGDLVYPHHECEIAQSQSYTGEDTFARFWMHVGMVRYEGEKMSKSLGNLVLARDVLRYHTPDAIRLYLLSHHYRDAWEYHNDGPSRYEPLVETIRQAMLMRGGSGLTIDVEPLKERFMAAVSDDLDTPTAIEVLAEMAQTIFHAAQAGQKTEAARLALRDAGSVLGLRVTR